MSLGIIVFTHASLADGFAATVDMIVGKPEKFTTLSFVDGDNLIKKAEEVKKAIRELGCDNTLVFTDLYGASPNNSSCLAIAELGGVVIAGTNLCMLLEAAGMAEEEGLAIDEVVEELMEIGRGGIKKMTKEMLKAAAEAQNN